MDELFDFLIKKDVEYKRNQPMSQYTSVRIGGCASVIAFPSTEEQLIDLVRFLYKNNIEYRVIGRMTNVLPCDGEYRGVIVLTGKLDRYNRFGSRVVAECGISITSLIMRMARLGLGGAESFYGIPGSLGGMIVSNAGAYGSEIGDIIRSVRVYSPTRDRVITIMHEELGFSYRKSVFSNNNMIILSAELELVECDFDIILEKVGKIRQRRAHTQPIGHPSLGSVFKRANGVSAAQIIDRCGLKGLSVGDAMVSTKHAGFIVNNGAATSAEFRELIRVIKAEVYRQCAIVLEEEIEFI